MKSGWYNNEYVVVKPLKNGHKQSLIMGVYHNNCGRWDVFAGVFSSNATYHSIANSDVWTTISSTNKNPSIKVLSLALEALGEIEQEIHNHANGKRAFLYVDGMDERRLRVYTKVLTKKCGYKKSSVRSRCGLPLLYKRV